MQKEQLSFLGHAVLNKWVSRWSFLLLALCLSLAPALGVSAKDNAFLAMVAVAELPAEARATLVLIKQGGPYPHARDGVVFGNYEKILPRQPRGYYHEFTVATPGAHNRGARRIIVGGEPPKSAEYFYTGDHYATFKRIQE